MTITKEQIDGATDSQGRPQLTNGAVPQESLAYLFDPSSSYDGDEKGRISFPNVQGLLQLDENGNYFYDSRKYFAEFHESTNNFAIYDIEKTEAQRTPVEGDTNYRNINVGFFPFDTVEETFTYTKEGSENTSYTTHMYMNQAVANRTSVMLNHYLGMTMEVDFQQPFGGMVSSGEDMVFKFSGDDDVWIFIDDVLVADLGSIHGRQSVEINFASGEIIYGSTSDMETTNLLEQFTAAGKGNSTIFNGNTFSSTSGTHTLKMFYLERGHNESNLELSFNLVAPVNSKIIKLDQNGDPVQNATFDLYKANVNNGVYEEAGNAIATGLTTDQNGEVELVYQTGNNAGQPIEFENDQHYILKETAVPSGYESPQNSDSEPGEIWLYCETFNKSSSDATQSGENLLLVDEKSRWETGAVSNITVAVTQSDENLVYRNDYAENKTITDAATTQNGLILAVPWLRQTDASASTGYSDMVPIYGSNLDGYRFAVDNIDTDNLSLLQAAFKAAMYQIYYAKYGENLGYQNWYMAWYDAEDCYYGTLTDLPGNASRYLWTGGSGEKDLSVAYYFLDWNTAYDKFGATSATGTASAKLNAIADKIQSYVNSNGGDLDMAVGTLMETIIDNNDDTTPDDFDILDSESYSRQFAMRLYVPNVVRELQVQKVDDLGQPVPGVEFTLTVNSVDGVSQDLSVGQTFTGTTDQSGMLVFSARGTGAAGSAYAPLQPGSYTLQETRNPYESTLATNPKATEGISIQVTNHQVYADAGDAGDGVVVRKGLGKLVQSMVRYIDGVNVTLRDIKATLRTGSLNDLKNGCSTANQETKGFKQDNDQALDLHYGLSTAILEYGTHTGDSHPYFETDTGVIAMNIRQNNNIHTNASDEYYNQHAYWQDLVTGTPQYDVSNLFSGSTTVVVTNEKKSANTGALTVRKEVLTREASSDTEKTSFNFTLSFDGGTVSPGDYNFTIYYTGKVRTTGTLTVDDTGGVTVKDSSSYTSGNTFLLKDGYYLTVTGLPLGAQATVTEQGAEGKKYTVYVTDDSSSTATENTGTINGTNSSATATTSLGAGQLLADYRFNGDLKDSLVGSTNEGTISKVGDNNVSVEITQDSVSFSQEGNTTYGSIQIPNPLKGRTLTETGFTVTTRVNVTSSNSYQGLWGFEKETGGFFGISGDGSYHLNDWQNHYTGVVNLNLLDSSTMQTLSVTVDPKNEKIYYYINGTLKHTEDVGTITVGEETFSVAEKICTTVSEASYFNLGIVSSVRWETGYWGTAAFTCDSVQIYAGQPDDVLNNDGTSNYRTTVPDPAATFDFNGTLDGTKSDGTSIPGTAYTHTQTHLAPTSDGRLNFVYALGTNSYNMVQWDNPLKGNAANGFTLSMLMTPNGANNVNAYEGLFSFATGNGYFGMGGNGSLWFNDWDGNYFDFWRVSADTLEKSRTFISQDEGEFLLSVAVSSDRVSIYKNSVLVYQITQSDIDAYEQNSETKHPHIFQDILNYVNSAENFNLGCASTYWWGTAGFSADFVRLYSNTLNRDQVGVLAANYAPEAQLLFENVEVADLEFNKVVVGGTNVPSGGYAFQVSMTLPDGVGDGNYLYTAPAASGAITTSNRTGTADIWLSGDQTCLIQDVPVGTQFTIAETSTGYYTTIQAANGGSGFQVDESEVSTTPVQGTSTTGALTSAGADLTFTNRQGTITVTKRDGIGNLLEGAGFTLYTGDGKTQIGTEQRVALYLRVDIQDTDDISNGRITIGTETYIVQNESGESPFYYRPLNDEEIRQYHAGTLDHSEKVEAVLIFTGLNIDQTYLLRETTTPKDYVQAPDITGISFDTDAVAGIALPGDDLDLLYTVENHHTVVMPSTGWNPFLLGGIGLLMMGAGVVLLLQKRRKKIS